MTAQLRCWRRCGQRTQTSSYRGRTCCSSPRTTLSSPGLALAQRGTAGEPLGRAGRAVVHAPPGRRRALAQAEATKAGERWNAPAGRPQLAAARGGAIGRRSSWRGERTPMSPRWEGYLSLVARCRGRCYPRRREARDPDRRRRRHRGGSAQASALRPRLPRQEAGREEEEDEGLPFDPPARARACFGLGQPPLGQGATHRAPGGGRRRRMARRLSCGPWTPAMRTRWPRHRRPAPWGCPVETAGGLCSRAGGSSTPRRTCGRELHTSLQHEPLTRTATCPILAPWERCARGWTGLPLCA